jgi:hypothetical protein
VVVCLTKSFTSDVPTEVNKAFLEAGFFSSRGGFATSVSSAAKFAATCVATSSFSGAEVGFVFSAKNC